MKSRSEMKRIATQNPEVLIREIEKLREECERLRKENEKLQAENYARKMDSTRTYDGMVQELQQLRTQLDRVEKAYERLKEFCGWNHSWNCNARPANNIECCCWVKDSLREAEALRNTITLSDRDRDTFLEALENPPEPNEALKALAKLRKSGEE